MYLGFIHVIRISFNCHLNNWWVNFSTYTYILKYLFTVMPSSCLYVLSTFYAHFFLFHTIIFVYLFAGNWLLILSYFTFFWQLPVLLCVMIRPCLRVHTHTYNILLISLRLMFPFWDIIPLCLLIERVLCVSVYVCNRSISITLYILYFFQYSNSNNFL